MHDDDYSDQLIRHSVNDSVNDSDTQSVLTLNSNKFKRSPTRDKSIKEVILESRDMNSSYLHKLPSSPGSKKEQEKENDLETEVLEMLADKHRF